MIEPVRMLDDAHTSALQRSLLGALADERASGDARKRTLAALGLPVIAVGAAAGAASASAAAKGTLGLLPWVKWGGTLLALSIVGGSAYVVTTQSTPTPVVVSAPHAAPQRAGEPVPTTTNPDVGVTAEPSLRVALDVPDVADVPGVVPDSLPRAGDPKNAVRSMQNQRVAAAKAPGTLVAELSLMDRARQSFAQGAYADSVRAVSTYEARYPHGALVQEAEFIRVRALYEQHDERAPRAAHAFLTQYPTSPYAPRVRTLVGRGL